jgi:epoxyqueuosine reductase
MDLDSTGKQVALSRQIKEAGQRLGFDLVGISPVKLPPHGESFAEWLRGGLAGELGYMTRTEALRRNPHELVPWAVSVVSVGMNYYTPLERPKLDGNTTGWISRYAWGEDYHDIVTGRLESLLEIIRKLYGGPVEGRAFVDSGPVLEREFAATAGIGWVGKNTHLISPRKGSWFFLGELFLGIPLDYDRPVRNRCGNCNLCLQACPTAAFVGPYVLDARRCISYLTIELKGWIPRELRALVGNHIFGCDICQEVCPYNVKATPSQEAGFAPRHGLYAPDLIPFLSMTAAQFRERFRGSPILRAKRRGFLRNVAVALGNLRSFDAIPALIRALDDDEPLVRGHVAWALGRIGSENSLAALERRLSVETDPQVKSEILEAIKGATESLREE